MILIVERAFNAGLLSRTVNKLVSPKHPEADVKLLVRPVGRFRNVEAKIDTLADQLSNLNLFLKRKVSRAVKGSGRRLHASRNGV